MEISKELTDALNDQINYELYSGYIYLSMATYMEEQNLNGMANWLKVQAEEEYEHAMKFWNHVADRGGRVTLAAIEEPKTEWQSPLEVFQDAYEHEMKVTKRIFNIGELADKLGDRSVEPLLAWFYDEQVEEEEQTARIRDFLKMIGDSKNALFMLDQKLGARED
jgi:ferritin